MLSFFGQFSFPHINNHEVILSRGGVVKAFSSQVGQAKVVHNTFLAQERGSTMTSADCFEEDASCQVQKDSTSNVLAHKLQLSDCFK